MALSLVAAKAAVDAVLAKYASVADPASLLGTSFTAGKVYEAWVLAEVLQQLEVHEGYVVKLVGGSKVHLKSSPGPINRKYPRFELHAGGQAVFEVWTDVEFSTLSYAAQGLTSKPGPAHRHELDVVVVPYGTKGYPPHSAIKIGVECKNTTFAKSLARAALGVRRELSLLSTPVPTSFAIWPTPVVPADPPSVLLVYSTDKGVDIYNDAGAMFGVMFHHEPM